MLVVPPMAWFGSPPSLVLVPGYIPNVPVMSRPFCVVATPNTKAAGRRPLLTEEAVDWPSISVQARPPAIGDGFDWQLE